MITYTCHIYIYIYIDFTMMYIEYSQEQHYGPGENLILYYI
jgi:hypothetical protein